MAKHSPRSIDRSVTINAEVSLVWHFLTDPHAMRSWVAEPEVQLDVETTWLVGSPIVTRGVHNGVAFENRGVVLRFEPYEALQYSHLSSLSRLPERPESYCIFEFRLQPSGDHTVLSLSIHNFPTESIYKHLDFYWRATLNVIKHVVEAAPANHPDPSSVV